MVSQRVEQQSPPLRHAAPVAWQRQRPLVQFIVPQHSLFTRQVAPELEQHCARPVLTTVLHTSTPQHSVLLVHVASPWGLHPVGGRHVPVWQVSPAQQSRSLAQVLPLPRQVQTRVGVPSHCVSPQH